MCKCYYDCLMMILAAMSAIGALISMIVAISIYKRQRNIALFDRRTKILDDFQQFVDKTLPSWGWDGSLRLVNQYSEEEIRVLFDDEYVSLYRKIIETAKHINELIGDYKYAENKGLCHDKTSIEIEEEMKEKEDELYEYYMIMREKAFKKWLSI